LQNTLRAIFASRELPLSQLPLGSFAIGSDVDLPHGGILISNLYIMIAHIKRA
jgi:hypothetical protein